MKDLIQSKLQTYECRTAEDEENALKEITQEVALYALGKSGFFKEARFQGGTCLRIMHGIDRFSEDLDFALVAPNLAFDLEFYLQATAKIMAIYGYSIEVAGKDRSSHVRARFLKDDSIKRILNFNHFGDSQSKIKIKIKIEVDINPPAGAIDEPAFGDFPIDYAISAHDLPSLFAGKCHALLCREYTKGRDWYDFSWYVTKGVKINKNLLANALFQSGPWQNKTVKLTDDVLQKMLLNRIAEIKWEEAVKDVTRFLRAEKREVLTLWSEAFFASKVKNMFRR
jgi:predicted nucleotidyltransferase component of viral defense system